MNNAFSLLVLSTCMLLFACESVNKDGVSNSGLSAMDTSLLETELVNNDSFVKSLVQYKVETAPSSAKVTVIDQPAIVYIRASENQIAKMKEDYGEEDFYTVADDNGFYVSQYSQMLDSLPYSVIRPDTRYLLFKWENESMLIDTEKDGNPTCLCWDYVMFNSREAPKLVDDILLPDRRLVTMFMEEEPSIFGIEPKLWERPSSRVNSLLEGLQQDQVISDQAFADFLTDYS